LRWQTLDVHASANLDAVPDWRMIVSARVERISAVLEQHDVANARLGYSISHG
jgi:hypothetical protein